MSRSNFTAVRFCTICIIICVMFSNVSCSLKRKLDTTFWPNCADFKDSCGITAKGLGNNVVYTKASTSKHDDLHYVFSTIGVPTIILARTTGIDTSLYFNWDKLMNGTMEDAITFSKTEGLKVDYKYAVVFTRLIEYNDTANAADLTNKKLNPEDFFMRDFRDFLWTSLPAKSDGNNSFVFNSTSDFINPNKSNNGSLSFAFDVYGAKGRASELPAMMYTANVTQFDFVLANYTPSYVNSRFALETVLVSLSDNKKMRIDTAESIDDEYSPGVFQVSNWLSNPSQSSGAGFLQWKPVSYLSKSRGRKSATKVKHYEIVDVQDRPLAVDQVKSTIVEALFGTVWNQPDVIVRSSNISFGLTDDGYFLKNNYTVWNANIGYGEPPADAISTTVIAIISAGLGIPVILIVFGGLYTIVRRLRVTNS